MSLLSREILSVICYVRASKVREQEKDLDRAIQPPEEQLERSENRDAEKIQTFDERLNEVFACGGREASMLTCGYCRLVGLLLTTFLSRRWLTTRKSRTSVFVSTPFCFVFGGECDRGRKGAAKPAICPESP